MTTTLTDRQQEVLSLLDDLGPLKVAEIAKAIGATATSTRETLMSLNARNEVRRYRGQAGVRWGRR